MRRGRTGLAVLAAMLGCAACGSSGGGAPFFGSSTTPGGTSSSTVTSAPAASSRPVSSSVAGSVPLQQVESALEKSTDFSQIKAAVPAAEYDKALSCVARVLQRYANGSDLKAFVEGRKTLDDVQGTDASAAATEAKQCVEALSGGS